MAFRAASLRLRAMYEDFQPRFETAETPEAHILKIHLPGFVMEQVRMRYAGSNMLNVSGERPITGIYKWSRFKQAYPVPVGCNVKRLKAKFEEGILTITMPKKSISQAAAPQEVKTSQEKAPSPSMEAVAEPKTEKAQVETPPKLALEPRDKKRVSSADLKDPNTSKEAVAEPRSEKEQVKTPPKSAPPVEELSNKRSVLFANLRALSTSKDAAAELKTEKTKVETPPKSAPTFMEEPRDKKRDSSADLKALSPSEEAAAEPKSETAQVETPPKSTLPSMEEPRDKKSVSSADLKSLSHSKEVVAEPITEKAQVETPQKSTPPFEEEPTDKRSVSFADQKAPKDEQDTTTAQKPLPDIEKPADDNQLRSLTPSEPIREVNKPQVVQREILQKPTETTADPNLQTGGVVQKDEEFEPKPTLPTATTKQTDENTEKGPGEFLPKNTLTTAPLDPKKQIEDQLQKALEDVMQKHENIVERRAPDPEEKELKEKIAKSFEPRMPEKGMDKNVVKATESKESRELGMAVKPSPETPEKEQEATEEPATIYKEKHAENIIDTIERGIKEVAASTSYAVTNIEEHKFKNEEKNLLTMVMGALAAHVSYRLTSSGKPQN
ncbi:hypothetical protein L6164_023288 [Bauhinia variegata]|uniref:Uncharacterized protein n=1 Tax=Bauhinia variegata TaxID=167791 RepID=A0ACB9MJ40_BAUVA|nr:hypothetical protein L6164_023288 [Bauhinia variegata]